MRPIIVSKYGPRDRSKPVQLSLANFEKVIMETVREFRVRMYAKKLENVCQWDIERVRSEGMLN